MELEYFLPQADVREYVRAYYYFSSPVDTVQQICAELGNIRIMLEGTGELKVGDAPSVSVTPTFLLGPTMSAYTMHASAGVRVFGIGIRPRGWVKLFNIDASEAADRILDLSEVAARVAGMELDEVRNAKNPAEMARICDEYFAALLRRRTARTPAFPQALEDWLLNDETLDIDRLIASISASRRQTDRLAKIYFGASPKLLQRKYRALRVADRIREGEPPWTFAAGPGFYDQSHFIKEFKRFVGVTPSQFSTNQMALLRQIRQKRGADILQIPLASV